MGMPKCICDMAADGCPCNSTCYVYGACTAKDSGCTCNSSPSYICKCYNLKYAPDVWLFF